MMRRSMKKYSRILALALGFSLGVGHAACAEVVVPPIPAFGELGNGTPGGTGISAGNAANTPAGGAGTSTGSGADTAAEPTVASEGAVLMDGASGKVLFGKNQDTQFYPASITKVMTALVVLERCSLGDTVTFSANATTNLESGAVSLNITEGDTLTVEQALYGLLLKSANEIGNGLAEHVAGSVSAFADLMNEKARSLGCKHTNFRNPHGLNDSAHKTTPYDMALIMRAALQNETFRRIDTTVSYEFPATKKASARTITMGHKMMYPSDSRYYEGIIGGKTGYTSLAGNTLVTGVERDGVRLIAVVMKGKGSQYTDTKALLDYGFANYAALTGTAGTPQGTTGTPQGPVGTSQGVVGTPQGTAGTPQGTTGTLRGPGETPQSTAGAPVVTAGSSTPISPVGETAAESAAESASAEATDPETTSAGTTAETTAESTAADGIHGWQQDGERWYYVKENGRRAAGEWLTLDGLKYWFDVDAYMATGWRKFDNGDWYYFKPTIGYMVKNTWVQDVDWYYFGADGVMLKNTTTPDGNRVDEYGIWVPEQGTDTKQPDAKQPETKEPDAKQPDTAGSRGA